jgi:hypothetical protein
MNMQEQIMLKILLAVISFIGGVLVYQFKGISEHLRIMGHSVQSLNEKIAVIIKDQEWHMREIETIKEVIKKGSE